MTERQARRLESQTVHDGRVFRTTRDRVMLPNGRQVVFDVVRHGESVVMLPMPDPQHVFLVRQYRYVIDRWIWELPAGSVNPGELPDEAARRECYEEVGRLPQRVERLGELYPSPGFCDEVMIFFRCSDLFVPDVPAAIDEDEILTPTVFTMDEARAMVDRHDICDMKTVVGLEMAHRRPGY